MQKLSPNSDDSDFSPAPKKKRPPRSSSSYGDKAKSSSGYGKKGTDRERPYKRKDSEEGKRSFGDDKPRRSFGDKEGKRSFGDDKPRRSFGDKEGKRSFGDDKPRRSFGDKEGKRSFGDDKPRRSFGDKEGKRSFGDDKPRRSFGDKEGKRSFGDDKPRRSFSDKEGKRSFGDDKPRRSFGDKEGKRSFGDDKPRRSFGDKEGKRSFGDDKPRRSFGDKEGKRSFGDDKPRRSFGDKEGKRSFGDDKPRRSFGDKEGKRSFGDDKPRRSFGDKEGKRSFGDDKPRRSFGDKPRSSGKSFGASKDRKDFSSKKFSSDRGERRGDQGSKRPLEWRESSQNFSNNIIVACAPSVTDLVAQEIKDLGFTPLKVRPASIILPFSMEAIYTINFCSRMAQRVLLPIKTFRASSRDELYEAASEVDWSKYMEVLDTFAIDSHVFDSEAFDNSLFTSLVIKDAICDHFRAKSDGLRPTVQTLEPDLQLHLHIFRDMATLSIDTSGAPLYRRGYRRGKPVAPLQETNAAALLTLGKFSPQDTLCDPCCGTGTILIEALLMATNTPPGFLRQKWGFQRLPEYNESEWLAIKDAKMKAIKPLQAELIGIEKDTHAFRDACKNIQALDRERDITLIQSDFAETLLTEKVSLFVTNPPYGQRLGKLDTLKETYKELGQFMRSSASDPARAVVITSQNELIRAMDMRYEEQIPLNNGPIESSAYLFNLK